MGAGFRDTGERCAWRRPCSWWSWSPRCWPRSRASRASCTRSEHIARPGSLVAVALELASALSFVVVFRLFFDRLARDARSLAWTEQGSGALLPGGGAGGLAMRSLPDPPDRSAAGLDREAVGRALLPRRPDVEPGAVGGGVALIAGAAGPHDFLRVVLPTSGGGGRHAARSPRSLRCSPLESARASPAERARHRCARGRGGDLHARRPNWRLLGAVGYLGFDIAVLWVTLRASVMRPASAVVMLAYSIGYAANALPVPGGIGVLDAGLTGALYSTACRPCTQPQR